MKYRFQTGRWAENWEDVDYRGMYNPPYPSWDSLESAKSAFQDSYYDTINDESNHKTYVRIVDENDIVHEIYHPLFETVGGHPFIAMLGENPFEDFQSEYDFDDTEMIDLCIKYLNYKGYPNIVQKD